MECPCKDEMCPASQLETEEQARRHFADVGVAISLRHCVDCGRLWLHCAIEDSENAGWNRWYRSPGSIHIGEWSFEAASEAMMSAPWHFYGGPYYRGSGERAFGAVPIREVLAPPPPAIEDESEFIPINDDSILWSGMEALV